ncbi:MAG: glucose-1-phosphate adenylyltransferase [Thiohalocapsa sp.]|jgi:glucose-1-phosphate adenylyltransferase|uniref:glucose-1-phosphate adenylyltransferase family protein n=1 Tax=Thiohalocapsa sp. TaxID=2497641 RepID=UPI0025CD0201|nr:sugar phosphate nucleotidyltransferase [Thiohalocapsa sp.]MCG6939790.1 glucose-1-phosphate adenylyltransferase [Thiohalocapsa sp.]
MPSATLTFVFAIERGAPAPLTLHRTKAAVPFAGKYRVIDFTLANCLHSGQRQVLVLTQYKSHSLHKHLRDAWSLFNAELGEFITAVPPQMRGGSGWYGGVLDALRQNRYLIERSRAKHLLLLDGGVVYRMDYAELIRCHREQGAGVTCAVRPAGGALAPCEVMLDCDAADRIIGLHPTPADLPTDTLFDAPMGVYVVDRSLLLAELDALAAAEADAAPAAFAESPPGAGADLATHLLPRLLDRETVCAYRFGGERGRVTPDRYWSDLGSTDAYFRANMALLAADPPLDLYQADWNILTYQGQYPPARTVPGPKSGNEGIFVNSMLASGTVIRGGGVSHSVLFPLVQVEDGAIVDEAILFEGVKVGEGAQIRRCICDKDVVIGPGERIGFDRAADEARFDVSPDGIVVIPKGQTV